MKPILHKTKFGGIYSVDPPTTYLTFAYWIYMVPQYKPENILILGFGEGTVAGLIRLLYGDVPITAVDITPPKENKYNVNFIQADANEFVKTCGNYDAVLIDIFNQIDTHSPCSFVSSEEFVLNIKRIANYITLQSVGLDVSNYRKHFRKVGINKASECSELVYYFENKTKIPDLHPYK